MKRIYGGIYKNLPIFLLVTILEYLFSSYKTYTDGYNYTVLCTALNGVGIKDIFNVAINSYAGLEPISIGVLYSTCYFGIDYSIANIVTNYILIVVLIKLFPRKYFIVVLIFLISNYYILLLFFGLFRLKVAIIFFVLAYLCDKKNTKKIVLLLLSLLSHFQITINVLSELISNKLFFLKLLFISTLCFITLTYYGLFDQLLSYLADKFEFYSYGIQLSWKIISLFIMHSIVFGVSRKVISFFLFIIIVSLFVGDGRSTILYMIFLITQTSDLISKNLVLDYKVKLYLIGIYIYCLIKASPFIYSLIEGYSYFEY